MVALDGLNRDRRTLRAIVPQEELRAALQADELTLHYQPIVVLASGVTRGVEALVRWEHPQGGLLHPDDFLPAVAHTPVMRHLTSWVLRRALADLGRWPGWTVSVNISASDVVRHSLVPEVVEVLETAAMPAGRLTLELTEQAVVQDLDTAVDVLGRLRAIGVGVSLDDFGTGYSSLLYLRELPITEVKIDRTFVSRVESSADDAAIVDSVVRLAHAVGADVVAEGVETAAQASYLRQTGCGAAQGYLWGRPCAADDVPVAPHPAVIPATPPPAPPLRRDDLPAGAAEYIQSLLGRGASLHTIAAALNRKGLRTARGARWSAVSVATHVPRADQD